MGALAEGFVAYVQPLLEQSDGTHADLNKAFSLGQFCYNLALMPEESRDSVLSEMRSSLEMDDQEFDDFRRSVIDPMIRRHQSMFPQLHNRGSAILSPFNLSPTARSQPMRRETYPGTDRYAPCPCNSGRKYKFCCGKKGN
jgi:hypothetical protein